MKMLGSLAAGVCLCVLPAAAQDTGGRLSPPVNVVQAAPAAGVASEAGAGMQRQSMVIEEDGTIRFLTPEEAANLFIPVGAESQFYVDLNQSPGGPDSLRIEVSGAEITDLASPDGATRILRIEPDDGSPARMITITKD